MLNELFAPLIGIIEFFIQLMGPIGLFIGMIVQAIIIFIPSEGVIAAAGMFIKPLWSVYLWAILGSIAGASLCFYIARKGGRPIIKKLLGEETLKFMDSWVDKWGDKGVLIGRLIPFVPYDPISYLSGVTSMSFKSFTIYNSLGTIPRVILYATLGSVFTAYEDIGIIIVGALIISLLIASIYTKKKMSSRAIALKNKVLESD